VTLWMNDPGTLSARLEAFRERTLAFKSLGYDRFGAAALVAEMAGRVHGTALDVGTGEAVMASTLAAFSGAPVVTVDVDGKDRDLAELVAFEAGVVNRIRFVRADGENLPFSDGQFSCAVTMDTLHHMVDAEGVTRELARVLARGGVLVVADFTEEGFGVLDRVLGSHPRSGITVDTIAGVAERCGLKRVLRAEGFKHQVAVFRKSPEGRHRNFPCTPTGEC
jgi:ubiquinone/menaquinone biosynthesis C-methylase UbiE